MTTRIVVTGIGIVSPVGLSRDGTWKNLLAGVSGIDHIAAFNPEDLETTIAGEVKGFEPDGLHEPEGLQADGPLLAVGGRSGGRGG